MHTVDPAGVVIGGAMTFGGREAPVGRRFLERIRAEVRRRALPALAERTTIEFASLGSDAGFIGAAGLARRAFGQPRASERLTPDGPGGERATRRRFMPDCQAHSQFLDHRPHRPRQKHVGRSAAGKDRHGRESANCASNCSTTWISSGSAGSRSKPAPWPCTINTKASSTS